MQIEFRHCKTQRVGDGEPMQPTTVLQPASKTKKHKKRNAPILHLQAFKANPMPLEILKPKPYPVSPPRTGLCRRAGGSRGRHVFNKIRPWMIGGSRFEGFWALSRTWGKTRRASPIRSPRTRPWCSKTICHSPEALQEADWARRGGSKRDDSFRSFELRPCPR